MSLFVICSVVDKSNLSGLKCHNGITSTFFNISKETLLWKKTLSCKIMRRILRKVAGGETEGFGDVSTLLNPEIVEEIKDGAV